MQLALAVTSGCIAVFCCQPAEAFPEGAPWGSANPQAEENCSSCHFDKQPRFDSQALGVDGLPERLIPGKAYNLRVWFDNPGGSASGFQLIVAAGEESAGAFVTDDPLLEAAGAAIRSTTPSETDQRVSWEFSWQVARAISSSIEIFVAASAANADQSPLGDTVHFRSYRFTKDLLREED